MCVCVGWINYRFIQRHLLTPEVYFYTINVAYRKDMVHADVQSNTQFYSYKLEINKCNAENLTV